MGCGACGEQLPVRAAFCHVCGARQQLPTCARCSAELLPGAVFCSACGTPTTVAPATIPITAAAASERRLTSVLFADLVSYTSLSEQRDTEDVRELLSAYFDVCATVIRRYGGTVEKFIGDAVMAVWGVPVAHEDDAERAVRAGLDLIGEIAALGERIGLPELSLRVGVVTGEVAATLGAQDQGMVAGDPVNTASRVQSAAAAGQVWVDAMTRSLTAAAVSYVDAGEHLLKGKAEAVHLYRAGAVVAAIGGLQRVDGLEAPLVGRDRELRLLKELFHATEESGRAQLVVLDGEAGVGKTRLGWEFEKYIDGLSRRVAWHRGRCLSYGDGVAFWALAEAVRARVGLLEGDSGAVVLDGLDQLLAERVADEDERQWLRPRVASLLGEEAGEYAREDLFAAWGRFFERVGAGDPVVLLIDDAEHLDDGLADFLEHLVTGAGFGCFVLLLARPDLLDARPQLGGRRATPVRVDPLSDSAMAELVDGLVDGLPDELRAGLVARAEGLPLFAVETVRALIDRDLVVPHEGRYVVASGQALDLSALGAPASLHALVAARLDALARDERRVLSDASVLGESFTREGIGILAGDVEDLDAVLAGLARKELVAIEQDRFSTERGQLRFVQSVVRQVAYATLSRRDRRIRHLQVADHLSGDAERAEDLAQVIAQHLLDAAESSTADDPDVAALRSRAGALFVRAAERATALSAHADAIRCYHTALGCLPDQRDQARVLTLQAVALLGLDQYPETGAVAQRASELYDGLGDPLAAAEAAYYQCRAIGLQGHLEESLRIARERHASVVDIMGAERVRGRLASCIALALAWSGRADEADGLLHEALRIGDQFDDLESFRNGCNALSMIQDIRGSARVARWVLDGLAQMARERHDWNALATALGNTAVRHLKDDLGRAIEMTEESLAVMVDHGLPPGSTLAGNLINYTWLAGDWDRTVQVALDDSWEMTGSPERERCAVAVSGLCTWAGKPVQATASSRAGDDDYREAQLYAEAGQALAAEDLLAAVSILCQLVDVEASVFGMFDDFQIYWPLAMRVGLMAGDEAAIDALWAHVDDPAPPATMPGLTAHLSVFRALLALRSPE
ncbi:MAG: AAA family ATPase, partial [Nocardioides sp.]